MNELVAAPDMQEIFNDTGVIASAREFREYAEALGNAMEADVETNTLAKSVCTYIHSFHNGIYTRHMKIPKGIFIVGYIHRQDHTSIISRGKILSRCENGGVVALDASEHPLIFMSPKGTRRMVLAVEDTYWTTIHATSATTVEAAEAELFNTYYEDFLVEFPELGLEEIAA